MLRAYSINEDRCPGTSQENRKCEIYCSRRAHSQDSRGDTLLNLWTGHPEYAFPPAFHSYLKFSTRSVGEDGDHPLCSQVAQTVLVSQASPASSPCAHQYPVLPRPLDVEHWQDQTSQPRFSPPHSMIFGWTSNLERTCLVAVKPYITITGRNPPESAT